MTLTEDKHLQTGIAGSLVIHALLLLVFLGFLQTDAARRMLEQSLRIEEKEPEPEVVMIFPDQVLVKAPEPEPKLYIRTTQNEEAGAAPKNAAFQSDRNTRAASELPPVAGATEPMPTLQGDAPAMRELANRDHRDGELKNDSAPSVAAVPTAAPTPQMLPPPAPATPPQQPQQSPPAPLPVVKAVPISEPLARMMQEMEKQDEVTDPDRLPIEVRKAQASPVVQETPPAMPAAVPETQAPAPQVREPQEDTPPPPVPRAIPVPDPILNTPRPERDAFSPFTRTSKTDGAIQTRGANAVDAEATPLGRYMRQVTGAVERKWHLYVRLGKDSVNFGRVRFRFYVDARGVPQDLRILSDARDADPRMRELTLRAILDAQIPPIPPDLLPTLDDGRVKIEYEAIVY